MREAFREAFRQGARSVVIIGSDCPGITADLLERAFVELETRPLVLGPACDGGYYLVGLKGPAPALFDDISWGRDDVLQRTLSRARRHGMGFTLLRELPDVDRPEDLPLVEANGVQVPIASPRPRLSVIIPTLNEAKNLPRAVMSARLARNAEVVVADGGSVDGTVSVAQGLGVRVVRCEKGRAAQMNVGAEAATGEMLVFCHADTRLPPGYDTQVRRLLPQDRAAGGAFRIAIDDARPALTFLAASINARSLIRRTPYGDQAFFVARNLFRRMGGFRDMPLMEDYEFITRLRRHGRIVIAPGTVLTSARRWRTLGVVRATLTNHAIVAAYRLGLSPQRLALWYRGAE
jgi:rSAM/selenodomain-associated transferase 2